MHILSTVHQKFTSFIHGPHILLIIKHSNQAMSLVDNPKPVIHMLNSDFG